VPRLNRFNAIRPDVDVAIDASPLLVDFRGHTVDLAIRHGMTASSWPRTQSRHLADCFDTPVLAPSMLESGPPLAAPSDLRHYTLLHVDNRGGWSDWFKAAGVDDIEPARGPIFPDSALAAQSAALGHGVALGCWLLSAEDLTSGRLLAPLDYQMPAGAYWLVAPDFDNLSEPAAAFAAWVRDEIKLNAKLAR
jgi:LysR family glycine cleavage system transcriptional activator